MFEGKWDGIDNYGRHHIYLFNGDNTCIVDNSHKYCYDYNGTIINIHGYNGTQFNIKWFSHDDVILKNNENYKGGYFEVRICKVYDE